MFTPFAFVKQAAAGGGGAFPLTTAFLAATGITDATIQTALEDLETGLTTYSLGSKMVALYPMVGGTSDTTKYNFMDTSLYTITWSGTLAFASTGVNKTIANFTTAYGVCSGLTPSSVLTVNNTHLAYYSRTQITAVQIDAAGGQLYPVEIGTSWGGNRFNLEVCSGPNNAFWSRQYSEGANMIQTNNQTATTGFYISSRTSSTDFKTFKNASQVGSTNTDTQSSTFSGADGNMCILGETNSSSTPGGGTVRECAYASIGAGLSSTEAGNLNTIVQAFQTTLGRNV
jgi:hypothetical protein